jgi:hypothetical protein
MRTDGWISDVLDGASEQLLALEQQGSFPVELRVSAAVYHSLASLRARELTAGLPLLVLGTEVTEDQELTASEFTLRP